MTREQAYKEAKEITKRHGVSYYFATRFFPYQMRYATYALYGFFRLPDEIVDNTQAGEDPIQLLQLWRQRWEKAYTEKQSDHPILWVAAETFHTYTIPYQYSQDFLDAMEMDLTKMRYETYEELQGYMYGSASVVGLMMSYIIGFQDGALEYASKLGEAMQMTNFLRDIREDYELRNRIYLPQEDLRQFGLTDADIHKGIITEQIQELLQFEILRTRQLYREAEAGIELLNKEGRFAVKVASRLYEAILDKIEEADYDIFSQRVKTSKREKLLMVAQEWRSK